MLDTILDWLAILLPSALSIAGVFVSLRAPHSRYHRTLRILLVTAGVLISVLTFWGQSRSRASHAYEVNGLKGQISGLNSQIATVQGSVTQLMQSEQAEVARREQAEKDLALMVQVNGRSTQQAVVSEMKSFGASVEAGRSALEKMNNKELRLKVKDYCNRILKFNSDHEARERAVSEGSWQDEIKASGDRDKMAALQQRMIQQTVQDMQQFELDFKEQFLVEGAAYRSELVRRLGPQPLNEPGRILPSAIDGHINQWSIDATAEYLEWVASKLPNSD